MQSTKGGGLSAATCTWYGSVGVGVGSGFLALDVYVGPELNE